MKPKPVPMKPVKMWAVVDEDGEICRVFDTESCAKELALKILDDTVRPVLITEIKPKPAKKKAK